MENVRTETRDGVLIVTIDRPKVLNALNAQTVAEIESAFKAARDDENVKAVIVTGGGEKAFVAGADIAELAEVTLGIIPGYGGTQRLARLVGKGKALEIICTADRVTAAEAEKIGLVNRVVPADQLINVAEEMAKKIASRGTVAVRYAIEAVMSGSEMPFEEGQFLEATLFGLLCATDDMKEGMSAFLEKRAAQFKGR